MFVFFMIYSIKRCMVDILMHNFLYVWFLLSTYILAGDGCDLALILC